MANFRMIFYVSFTSISLFAYNLKELCGEQQVNWIITSMAKIAFQEITKIYPGASAETPPAVDAVTFEVPEGSTCMLVGTSGSGKTTLLRMVNRLIEPTSGKIVIDGKNV